MIPGLVAKTAIPKNVNSGMAMVLGPNSTWTLPSLCHHCGLPVSSDQLINSPNGIDGSKDVECPNYFEIFEHHIKVTNGSPLNLALVGHWDGWQPFGTSYRGCG
ncbi:hypothetical protein P5673_012486 [Acropora cervicornis]|uniref:Uncharacterized protein n=1 Tax=Acropora cervicornis TaxID=6130 RepID=A0AAD9QMV4_ACRCE|nr:hypothetical protein P5673_012486 [Acropora cervicornis]